MEKQVTTVQGRVSAEYMGITDAHNHLWIARQQVKAEQAPVLDQQDLISKELAAYRQYGGGAQLDCQPGGAGRDGSRLYQLSISSGVHIVACTGFHLQEYYPQGYKIWQMDADQAAEYLLSEIREGLEETREGKAVFPGFIKIAVRDTLEKTPLHLLEAACIASRESGLLVEMHTEKGANVEGFVDYLQNAGLDPGRLVICHLDKRPDRGLHQALAGAGYTLEYDTFFRPKYDPEKNLWPLIADMAACGFSDSITLATDLADSRMWQFMGEGPGLAGFINIIRKRLEMEIGDPAIVDKLTGSNIARLLET